MLFFLVSSKVFVLSAAMKLLLSNAHGIFNAEVLLRSIVYYSTPRVVYKYIYTTILKIVPTPAISYPPHQTSSEN